MEVIGLIIVLCIIAIGFWLSIKMSNIPEWKYKQMQEKIGDNLLFLACLVILFLIIYAVGWVCYNFLLAPLFMVTDDSFGGIMLPIFVTVLVFLYIIVGIFHLIKK